MLAAGLESAGVTAWAGRVLVRSASGRGRLLVAVMALSALLAAVVTPSGAAAALLPVAVLAARRSGLAPARLLMPLAFAASAGALLVLSGSPVNVIVSDALLDATGHGFGFFEFALVGVPLTVVTLAVSVLWGDRLLPRRTPGEQPADLSDHLSTVIDHYRLERGFFRAAVRRGSSLVDLRPDAVVPPEGVVLIGVQHDGGEPGAADEVVRPGDVLVLTGGEADVAAFVQANDLDVVATPLTRATREALLGREVGVAEVVIAPRSGLVGQRVFPGQVRRSGLTVLGVRRLGRERGARPTTVAEGDMLLLHGPWPAVEDLARDDEVLVVDDPGLLRRQAAPLGPAAWRALGVLGVFVVLARHRDRAAGGGGADRGGRHGRHRCADAAARVPGRLVADGRAHRGPHPAVRGDQLQRGRRPGRRTPGGPRGQRLPAAAARRAVRADPGPGAGGQQHRDRAGRDPDRGGRGAGRGRRGRTGAHGRCGRRCRVVPYADRDAREHDRHGPGGVPVRRLLEARPDHHTGLVRRRRGAGAGHLADGLSALARQGRPTRGRPAFDRLQRARYSQQT